MTEAMIILTVLALVLMVILIGFAVALMERMNRIDLLLGDLLGFHMVSASEAEAAEKSKPPDPQAHADRNEFKTPLVRRSADKLTRRRVEAANG